MTSSHGEGSPDSTIGVDSICDAFEAAWLAGRGPRIEEFLSRGDALDPDLLLRELLLAEWDLRIRHAQHTEPAPYLDRFPANRPAIIDLWREWKERQPDSVHNDPTIGFVPLKDSAVLGGAGDDNRPLQAAGKDRRRRLRRRVGGRAARAGQAARRPQDHQAGHGHQAGRRPLRGRAAGAGADGPSEHRQGVRRRRDRRRAGPTS